MGYIGEESISYLDYINDYSDKITEYSQYVVDKMDDLYGYSQYIIDCKNKITDYLQPLESFDSGIKFKDPTKCMKIVPSTYEPEPKIVENESDFGLWCKINKTSNDFWKYKM